MQTAYHLCVIGAGASGIAAALSVLKEKRTVVLIDAKIEPAQKVLISGGGKCNFSNKNIRPERYVSQNPHFCKSALARLPVADVLKFCRENNLSYEEREDGKLFASSAKNVRDLFMCLLTNAGARFVFGRKISDVFRKEGMFEICCENQTVFAENLLIATGGLSYPAIGASDFAFRLAKKFNINVVPLAPALTPMFFQEKDALFFKDLSGVSCNVSIKSGKTETTGALLFTHKGISGPAVLQTSLRARENQPVKIDFLPQINALTFVKTQKSLFPKRLLSTVLSDVVPHRFAMRLAENFALEKPLGELSDKTLAKAIESVKNYEITPVFAGYEKAEVTKGGVDTAFLSSQTMETTAQKGLFFAGECLDVTGEIGGFNLHWAFASGRAAGLGALQNG